MTAPVIVATGSRSVSGTGEGRGVDLWSFEETGPRLLTSLDLPDPVSVIWSADGTRLFAVLDTSPARLVSIAVGTDPAQAEILGEITLQGAGATHLGHGHRPGTLVALTLNPAAAQTVRLDEHGAPVDIIDVDDTAGFVPERTARPIQALPLPGTDLLGICDAGLGSVFVMQQDSLGQLDLQTQIALGSGSVPVGIGADHESEIIYILDEARGEIAVATRRAEEDEQGRMQYSWSLGSRVPTSAREQAARPAHLSMSLRENFVLVVNRGTSTVAALSRALSRPELVAEADVAAGPVDFARWGNRVLIAAHDAGVIDVLAWDGRDFSRPEGPFENLSSPSITYLTVRP